MRISDWSSDCSSDLIVRTPPPVFTPTPVAAPPPPPPPPPKQAAKPASPRGNPGTWVTPDDYPSRALREEREGTTGFKLAIDANGKVVDCQITSSSGSPRSEEHTSELQSLMRISYAVFCLKKKNT